MGSALVLHPDGNITELPLPADADECRAEICRAIGCSLLDVVSLTTKLHMWIDDEGLYTQPMNPIATALARRHGYIWQPYFGTAVLAGVDEEGETINLTSDQVVGVLRALKDIASE